MSSWLAVFWFGCSPPAEPPPAEYTLLPTPPVSPLAADAGPDLFVEPGVAFVLSSGPLGEGVEASWSLSDGQHLQGARVEATLYEPGHHSAVLHLDRDDGATSSDGLSITAVYAKLTEAPRQASPVWLGDTFAVVVAWDVDALLVVQRDTLEVPVRENTCHDPRSVVVEGEQAWVLCRDSDRLQRFHWPTGTLEAEGVLPWGSRASSILHDGEQLIVVAAGRSQVFAVQPDSLEVVERFQGMLDGRAAVLLGSDLRVVRFRSDESGGVVGSGTWPGPVVAEVALGIDPGPDSDTNARGTPSQLGAVAIRPDGRQVAVGGMKANLERGALREGRGLTFETTVRADLRLLDVDGQQTDAVLFDDRDRVSALAYSEQGAWLYAAHGGMELIDVIDPYTGERAGVSTPVGGLVDALAVRDKELWALSSLGRTLVRYDLTEPALPQANGWVALVDPEDEPVDAQVLQGQRLFHRSNDRRLNEGGYVACASCHPDGEHDGFTWDFTDRGEGLRNTLPLVGRAGVGHGPLHWSANFDEGQDFEHDIRGPQSGLGLMTDADFAECDTSLGAPKAGRSEDLDALAAYMSSLVDVPRSPHRNDDGSPTAAGIRGEALFLRPELGCVDCHPPPSYTDSAFVDGAPNLHDVGTLTPASGKRLGLVLPGIDTPTLRGTGLTGPWLHDGSATQILDVFDGSDLHGVTSSLRVAELADLEAFLLQLE